MTADVTIGGGPQAVDLARRTSADLLQRVEDRLGALLAAERASWAQVDERTTVPIDALAELIASGGKRIRPAFCIAGYLAAGGEAAAPGIVAAAAALEMLHVSLLVHDDVLDDSSRRRGLPTVHAKHIALHHDRGWQGESRRYGEGVGILAGDLAMSYAEELMSQAPATAAEDWHKLCSEVLIGQYMDVAAAAEFSVDPAVSRLIARIKSGRYTIHRPLVVGASAAGRTDLAAAFAEYGEAVGEAFQLRDDLLDAFGDSADTGKPAGLDFTQHKMTLLLGWAMQRDDSIATLITEPGHSGDEVRAYLVDTKVPDDVEAHIAGLVDLGCKAITDAPIAPVWREELKVMARKVAYRNA
ncbi:MAG: polyprenyl synthetase family protein [Actinomycetia bacterium]|nr:polyprenyl synthetase family protein [Actinomycetes bacterium]